MATSFIRISSEDGPPDNPIKCLVWLRAVWANTGLFQLCLCLNDYVEISMSLCERAMVYGQSPMVLEVSQGRNGSNNLSSLWIFSVSEIVFSMFYRTITPLCIWI